MLCSLRPKQRPTQLLCPFKAQLAVSTAGSQQILTEQQETVTPPSDVLSAEPGLCRGQNAPQIIRRVPPELNPAYGHWHAGQGLS